VARNGQAMSNRAASPTPIADKARRLAPMVWLPGKVQSGKTSIIQPPAQASDGEIWVGGFGCRYAVNVLATPA